MFISLSNILLEAEEQIDANVEQRNVVSGIVSDLLLLQKKVPAFKDLIQSSELGKGKAAEKFRELEFKQQNSLKDKNIHGKIAGTLIGVASENNAFLPKIYGKLVASQAFDPNKVSEGLKSAILQSILAKNSSISSSMAFRYINKLDNIPEQTQLKILEFQPQFFKAIKNPSDATQKRYADIMDAHKAKQEREARVEKTRKKDEKADDRREKFDKSFEESTFMQSIYKSKFGDDDEEFKYENTKRARQKIMTLYAELFGVSVSAFMSATKNHRMLIKLAQKRIDMLKSAISSGVVDDNKGKILIKQIKKIVNTSSDESYGSDYDDDFYRDT